MGTFHLKERDLNPVFEAALKNPDNSAFDLTGLTVKFNIVLAGGIYLQRTMAIEGPATDGVVRYVWVATDWDAGSDGTGIKADPYLIGGLVPGPTLPLSPAVVEHQIECEVYLGGVRITFPNTTYDTLRIIADIGQGA